MRKIIGWILLASQLIIFPTAAFYFLRDPLDTVVESALAHIIIGGLVLLFVDLLLFLGLTLHQAIFKRENFSEDINPFVIE
jgi:hypothetical protein